MTPYCALVFCDFSASVGGALVPWLFFFMSIHVVTTFHTLLSQTVSLQTLIQRGLDAPSNESGRSHVYARTSLFRTTFLRLRGPLPPLAPLTTPPARQLRQAFRDRLPLGHDLDVSTSADGASIARRASPVACPRVSDRSADAVGTVALAWLDVGGP